jgi:DNA repair protein RecO (recombination protein O)
MKTFQTEAIMLRRTNYGEADRILSLLTPDRGKLSAIARSVRKSKSKLAGGLELFATCHITITEGRGELGIITSARLDHFYGNLLHEYERLQLGYECIKLVNKATETVTEPEFYYLLRDTFAYLDALSVDYHIVELWFRLQFASLLGRGLNLARDEKGNKLQPEHKYNFDFQEMAFFEHPSGRFGAEHIKLLRLAATKNPAILRQVSGLGVVLDDCLWLVRTVDQ